MRESFVFYKSFYEAIQDLIPADQIIVYNAICEYALEGKEPNISGVPGAIFKLIKPQIDANNRRFENGKKGGRPKKPNNNQTETKPKPNVNVNVNVNDNVKTLRTKKSKFNDFEQNDYDFDKVEKKIISNGG